MLTQFCRASARERAGTAEGDVGCNIKVGFGVHFARKSLSFLEGDFYRENGMFTLERQFAICGSVPHPILSGPQVQNYVSCDIIHKGSMLRLVDLCRLGPESPHELRHLLGKIDTQTNLTVTPHGKVAAPGPGRCTWALSG